MARDPERVRERVRRRRADVRRRVDALRAQTVCRRCGGQPIGWHRPEHARAPWRRISKMRGSSTWAAILAEIARCDALCRRCRRVLDPRVAITEVTARRPSALVFFPPPPSPAQPAIRSCRM